MSDALKGKAAIITGSARNIGRAIAHALSHHGASVVIHGQSDRAAAESVHREIIDKGGNAFPRAGIYCREWGVDGIRLPGVDSKKAKME